jgi:hypothetical protein
MLKVATPTARASIANRLAIGLPVPSCSPAEERLFLSFSLRTMQARAKWAVDGTQIRGSRNRFSSSVQQEHAARTYRAPSAETLQDAPKGSGSKELVAVSQEDGR